MPMAMLKLQCRATMLVAGICLALPQSLIAQSDSAQRRAEVEAAMKELRNASPCWEYDITARETIASDCSRACRLHRHDEMDVTLCLSTWT